MKKRHRSICISILSCAYRLFRTATTAELSHSAVTLHPLHFRPHITAATMIGTISLAAMYRCCKFSSHLIWNHLIPCQAPQPQDPEASEASKIVWLSGWMMSDVPFQWAAKVNHHAMSALNSALRRIWSW